MSASFDVVPFGSFTVSFVELLLSLLAVFISGRRMIVVSDDRPGDGRAGGLPRLAEGHTAGGVRQHFYLCATPPRLVS